MRTILYAEEYDMNVEIEDGGLYFQCNILFWIRLVEDRMHSDWHKVVDIHRVVLCHQISRVI